MSLQIEKGQKAFIKKVEVKEKFVLATLTTGRKDKQTDKFVNSFWNSKFVGRANTSARELGEGDRIEISSAIITKEKAKDGKYYDNLTIFEFTVLAKGQTKIQEGGGFTPTEEEDDLPF